MSRRRCRRRRTFPLECSKPSRHRRCHSRLAAIPPRPTAAALINTLSVVVQVAVESKFEK